MLYTTTCYGTRVEEYVHACQQLVHWVGGAILAGSLLSSGVVYNRCLHRLHRWRCKIALQGKHELLDATSPASLRMALIKATNKHTTRRGRRLRTGNVRAEGVAA